MSRKYRLRRLPASASGSVSFGVRSSRRSRVPGQAAAQEYAARIQNDLAVDLPDEDLGEDLTETLDMYVVGSKPRCEEAEYLALVEDAIERIARGE